jgi:type II restriction/modification system DNA methylase subunit YeeA
MNKTNLKRYAPQARKDFIAAVTARAQLLGLSEVGGTPQAEPCTVNGEVAVIAGRPWPASVQGKRERLFQRMKRDGFAATLEAVAYTWFNRFAALRYMELHDYLGHGRRVLSNPEGGLPEALAYALDLAEAGDLPGLRPDAVRQLKLDNQDSELFRRVVVAQCNALHGAMPFLFERIDDDSELLLPDNLLRSDSVIAKLVDEIPEEDWAEVEIIGWLYQFYISEKKDQVIGKVVKSEDIPAATQLFTPNWIVQYLVQNSVGRLWLMANPQSTLAKEWLYYITPAEQAPEVQAQLDALIQTRVGEDGDAINPESITVLDPACGSGHILVVAYDVLKAIYLERGYQPRAIPRLILEKNLYGLDIDDRAAQMAGFALLMKARADDRRLFTATDEAGKLQPPKFNVLSLQESKGLSVDELATHLAPFKVQRATITALVDTFEHAKTFGSLIQIPYALKTHLAVLPEVLTLVKQSGDMYATAAADDLLPLVHQALVLAMQFDAVAANPPYMGGRSFNGRLKDYLNKNYAGYEKDLFSSFIAKSLTLAKPTGSIAIMTSFVWMFISSFESMRIKLLNENTLMSLIQLEYDAFEDAKAHICTFISMRSKVKDFHGNFIRLTDFKGAENQGPRTLEAIKNPECGWHFVTNTDEFIKIPGSPIAYWIKGFNLFLGERVGDFFHSGGRNKTHNNEKYLRYWWEAVVTSAKWNPYSNGGDFRKFYGNEDSLIDWSDAAKAFYTSHGGLCNEEFWGKQGVTWSLITSAITGFRLKPAANQYSSGSPTIFRNDQSFDWKVLGYLNSKVSNYFLKAINPTINTTVNDVLTLPYPEDVYKSDRLAELAQLCEGLARVDWGRFETASSFMKFPLLASGSSGKSLGSTHLEYQCTIDSDRGSIRSLETETNEIWINSFGLQDELTPEVPENQVTLSRADREKDSQRLISYAIGCMMGRYSLDEPGLIYAHAGNVGFEPARYATFPADADGIVPITDELWFADDACSRIREFLRAVWGQGTLAENMAWLAESLGTKASETPDETIRRYLADKFFKDHLQTYKKRPIYWLFCSGKQGAFQALVYLHRYHEGTLARLRAEYVVPLTSKIQSRIEMLQKDALAASNTAARNKLGKDVEKLKKKHVELLAYDEQLRHYADMRITLDLDDGVKVNYGKFGDLLEGVKAVTGGAGDD